MISSVDDVKNIYKSRDYKAYDIQTSEPNIYTFGINCKSDNITDGLVCRKYEENVAFHEQFAISKEHRQKGHARKIHKLECKYYKEHGISVIKLNAARDGICVWGKLGFKLVDNNYCNILLDIFRDYLIDIVFSNDIDKAKIVADNCKSFEKLLSKDYKKYILPNDKQSFTEYLYDDSRYIGIVAMKKEL